jgi:type IV secretion system protein VirD4
MNQAVMAWSAFKNMMRKAGRDPVWALVNLVTVPIRR